MQSVKVGDQIGELNLNFKDAIYEESKVLHEAAYQLQRLEYITQEEEQALTALIDERIRCAVRVQEINYIVMQTIRTKRS